MQDLRKPQIKILIIDDSPEAVKVLTSALDDAYIKDIATSGDEALTLLAALDELPDLILLDLIMPGMSGLDTCKKIKAVKAYENIPIIFLSASNDNKSKVDALSNGGVDYITKPFVFDEIRIRVAVHLKIAQLQKELNRHNEELETLVDQKAKEISDMQLSTIFALVKLTDYRDDILGSHLERTQLLCKLIAEKLAEYPKYNATITSGFIDNLYKASPLHDIGKVGIPDGIYLKPTKLTTEEFEIIKGHTTIGADTLKSILDRFPGNEFIRIGIDIARFHHEKWNGAGYPDGLIGEAIPLTARIMAVSDVFDALRTKRPYKNPFSHEDSIQIIIDGSGNHFDPSVVEAFLAIESSVKPLYV